MEELKQLLIARDYSPGVIDSAISRAKLIPRHQALLPVSHTHTHRRPIFVVPYDPRLPSIPAIAGKHWRSMVSQDQYLKEVFPAPLLPAKKY